MNINFFIFSANSSALSTGVNNLYIFLASKGASSPMTRRRPTSSTSLWSATRRATWAWWRTSACGERATPSASPTSPAWSATKCSASGPGPIGEDPRGNGRLLCASEVIVGQVRRNKEWDCCWTVARVNPAKVCVSVGTEKPLRGTFN